MLIHRVSRSLAFGKRLQVLLRSLEGVCDASVNVVTLLKVDVLKKIAPYASGRNGIAIHIDAGQLGNHTLHRHQSFAKVLANAGFYRPPHNTDPALPLPLVHPRVDYQT
jgi:hypothetical protein